MAPLYLTLREGLQGRCLQHVCFGRSAVETKLLGHA